MQDYLKGLNPSQRDAVVNTKGATLVIAGAGSGKTRVLTYRITHLLNQGVKPYKVLALTFTNKAAKEMKERIATIIGEDKARQLWMGTFHSIFAKILRKEAEHIGYPSSFTIYDSVDTKSIIKNIIKELQLDDQIYKPASVYGRISKAKNNLVTAAAYEGNQQARIADSQSKKPEIYRIYKIYSQRCFKAGAMDFDDLLLQTNVLFRDHPKILAKYQKMFEYILVDEYQDTNFSQYLIVKKLAEAHRNVCVVGDDAQSIYSFRGAKIENILNFKKDYPDFKMFKLEQNYRSTQNIVNAANSIIAKNENQIKKNVFSENETGDKIKVIEALTDNEEGFQVVNKIFDSVYTDHTKYLDHAILYRTNAQSRIFEEALRRRNIPYKIYGGTSFYQRKEIKDLLAYFKLTVNKQDDEALKRVVNYPKRGVGKTSMDNLEAYARSQDISIWEAIMSIPQMQVPLKINSRALNQIFGFANMINDFTAKVEVSDAYDMAKEIASASGVLQDLFKDKAPEGVARHENVQELLNGIKEFTDTQESGEKATLVQFLENVALLTNEDNEGEDDRNKVTLMTIHSSKGLEFRNVYLVGVEERLFPSEMATFAPHELEEERRLFYVAVTRAEKELFISYSRQRYKWGQLYDCVPSRFVKDIDSKFLDMPNSEDDDFEFQSKDNDDGYSFAKPKKSVKKDYKFKTKLKEKPVDFNPIPQNKRLKKISATSNSNNGNATDISKIKVGVKVMHQRFGIGIIEDVEGENPNVKATINFENAGEKKLLLKFAKLEVLG